MACELTYVMINPYSLYKSRTGNIINRLLSRTALDLVAAQMFAPGQEMVQEYANLIQPSGDEHDRKVRSLIKEYVLKNYSPDPKTGRRKRVMVLLLKGEGAVTKTHEVVGKMRSATYGQTIRDTYGDYIVDEKSKEVVYFEPAVLAPVTVEGARERLAVLAKYSATDGGILTNIVDHKETEKIQRSLVLIKPDNFKFPNGRPGSVMDLFSQTGMAIIGVKIHHMSVNNAEEFYGPVQEILIQKFGAKEGQAHFGNIIRFMCGRSPEECPPSERAQSGTAKIMALVYEGPNAVQKIREVLGSTDPAKAEFGTIRREFGESVMINAAHASDSPENAEREMKIINVGENNFKQQIETVLKAQ